MAQGNDFMFFLDDLLNRHDVKLGWLSEKTGLNASTFRRWRQGQKPSEYSLVALRKVIEENMGDELPLFDEAVTKLKNCAPSPMPDGLSEKIKKLEAIVDSRDNLDMEAKGPIKETVASYLIKYGFEFAENVARSITVSNDSKEYEYEDDEFSSIPKYIQPKPTNIKTKTFRLVEGFFLDITILSNE